MSTGRFPLAHHLPAINTLANWDTRLHAERLGQSSGCPCHIILQYVLDLLLRCSPCQFSDIVNGLIMPLDDLSHLSTFDLSTTVADWENPSVAAFSPTCHDLSATEPDFIHHPPQINPLNPDLNCSSINGSGSMDDVTLDSMLPPFEASLSDLDLITSMDVSSYQIQSESTVPQSPPVEESWSSVCHQGWETENSCCHFDGHSSDAIHSQAQNYSNAHLSYFPDPDSPRSTCSEVGSSLGNHPGNLIMCRWGDCHLHLAAEKSEVAKHLQFAHDVKPGGDKLFMKCVWDGCGKTMKKESISRHIVAVHLSRKTECGSCGKQFARLDSKLRHIKNSKRECSDSESESYDNSVKRPRLS